MKKGFLQSVFDLNVGVANKLLKSAYKHDTSITGSVKSEATIWAQVPFLMACSGVEKIAKVTKQPLDSSARYRIYDI